MSYGNLSTLPEDVISACALLLPVADIGSLRCVNKSFSHLLRADYFWSSLFLRHFGEAVSQGSAEEAFRERFCNKIFHVGNWLVARKYGEFLSITRTRSNLLSEPRFPYILQRCSRLLVERERSGRPVPGYHRAVGSHEAFGLPSLPIFRFTHGHRTQRIKC